MQLGSVSSHGRTACLFFLFDVFVLRFNPSQQLSIHSLTPPHPVGWERQLEKIVKLVG